MLSFIIRIIGFLVPFLITQRFDFGIYLYMSTSRASLHTYCQYFTTQMNASSLTNAHGGNFFLWIMSVASTIKCLSDGLLIECIRTHDKGFIGHLFIQHMLIKITPRCVVSRVDRRILSLENQFAFFDIQHTRFDNKTTKATNYHQNIFGVWLLIQIIEKQILFSFIFIVWWTTIWNITIAK
jgi:hypothetical protein